MTASHAGGEPAGGGGRPDLSIITVNYNSGDLLLECLRAVFEHTREVRVEYFVVDNASRPDGSLERIERQFPQVRMVRNATNVGFAAGCNVAIPLATGRFVLLLNPDTAVQCGVLDRMVAFLDANPGVAVLGSPLVGPDGQDQGVAGRGFPTPLAALFGRTTILTRLFPGNRWSAKFSSTHNPGRCEPYEVDWVSGACMMVRREAIEQVGALDPAFFFMWEDADWCLRMNRAGWRVCCSHEAGVVHREGSTRSRGVRALWLATAGFHRGAYRYYRKHIDPRRFGAVQLVVVAGLTARTLVVFVSRSLKSVWSRRVAFDSASLRAM
jgi:N-acetylglucosaminyl-diphospho-decaprenol L-rhamnosyltransferase